MTALQIGATGYFAIGLVRSYVLTRYYRSLVERPAGGFPRIAAAYLLFAVLWLPLAALRWLVSKLPDDSDGD